MTTLILNYHAISDAGGGLDNPHHLPRRALEAQLARIRESGKPAVSWRQLEQRDDSSKLGVAFTFDDGYRSDLDAAALLARHGFDGLFFVSTSRIGAPGYLDRNEVIALQKSGMGIGSHAHHHEHMTLRTGAALDAEFRQSKSILEELLQVPVEHFSFPGGAYDDRVVDAGRRCGFKYFYTSDWGVNGPRQRADGLFRRMSIINTQGPADIDALLAQRGRYRRQLAFWAKELGKKVLSEERYSRLRRAVLQAKRGS